jgi:hypothetical protein
MSAVVDRIMSDAVAGAQASHQRYFYRALDEAEGAFQRAGGPCHPGSGKAYQEAFLYNYLFCREMPADAVIYAAMAAGIHPSDLGEAHDALGITTVVNGSAKALWRLPDETYLRLQAWARTGYVPGPADALTRLIYSHSPPKRKPAKAPRSAGRSPKGK